MPIVVRIEISAASSEQRLDHGPRSQRTARHPESRGARASRRWRRLHVVGVTAAGYLPAFGSDRLELACLAFVGLLRGQRHDLRAVGDLLVVVDT